jgi:uncharacterized delta-60 repeat protein
MAVRPSDGRVVMVGRGGAVVSTITAGQNDSFFTNTGTTLGLGDVVWAAGSSEFVAAGGFSTIVASSDGQTWTNRSMVSPGINDGYNGIATNGTGAIVVVGGDFNPPAHAIIRYSSNSGSTWSAVASPPAALSNFNSTLTSVAYGASRFVAVGTGGLVTYSIDNGQSWTMGTSGTTQTLQHVSFGNGVFVAVGNAGTILTSTDGQTWAAKTSGTTQALFGINYLAPSSTWVAVGAAGTVVTSPDSLTWTAAIAPGITTSLNTVGVSGSYTFVVGAFGRILAAANPATFSPASLTELGSSVQSDYSAATFINHVEWDAATNQFVAVGSGGNVHTSSNGGQWNRRAVLSGFLSQVGRFGSKLVATGSGSVFTSTDGGSTWTTTSTFGGAQLNSLATSSAQAVVVGNAGAIYTSPDAVTWTSRTSGTTSILKRVVNGNGRFVAVGGLDGGGTSIVVLTSDDGITWTPRTTGTTGQLWGVDYANSTFVAVGSANVNGGGAFALRSTDNGVTWSRVEIPGASFLYSVRYQAGRWVAAGSGNVLAISTDNGLTWTYKPLPAVPSTNTLRSAAFGAGSMVVVGNDATILQSNAFPPTITAQPAGGNAVQGANFMLSVAASGSGQVNYQWYHNGTMITTNGTFPTLYVNNFQPADAGGYYVVVYTNGSNGTASVTSNTATVSIATGAAAIDYSFALPQFRRLALPARLTADLVSGSGKIYASFLNGGSITGANHQRIGAVMRLNANGSLDGSFTPNAAYTDAWGVVPTPTGQVYVGGVSSDESNESGVTLYRVFRLNGDGSRDYSFNGPTFTAIPRYMTLQPDGKLLVGPTNSAGTNGGLSGLVRLNTDGSIDGNFASPVFDQPNVIFATILVDAAGKIIIGGTFSTVNGSARPGVARLNANGTLDTTFVPSGFTLGGARQIRGLALQTQGGNAGKLLVAGGTLTVTTGAVNASVIRLDATGAIDPTFTTVVPGTASLGTSGLGIRPRLLLVRPDDTFFVLSSAVTRFTANGAVDATYAQANLSNESFWMDLLADGSVLVAPEFGLTLNGTPVSGPFKLTPSGALDGSFTAPSFQTEVYPSDFKIQPDGRVLIWGNFDSVNGAPRHGFARINANGSLDSLDLSGVANLYSLKGAAPLADGHILAATQLGTYSANLTGGISRFNADGTVDSSFTLDPLANASNLEALPDGTVLTWNQNVNTLLSGGNFFFKRLTATGAIDNTFTGLGATFFGTVNRDGTNTITEIVQGSFQIAGHYDDGRALAIATTPNGPYNVGATSMGVTVLRLNVDGSIDSSFTAPSISWGVNVGFTTALLDPVKGTTAQYNLRSLNGNPFSGVVPQPGGGVIVYGSFTSIGGNAAPGIARLTSTGAFDATFSVGTGPELRSKPGRHAQVESINTAPDGKIWVSGLFDTFAGVGAPGLVRLNADGTVDSTFGTNLFFSPYLGNGTKVGFGPAGQVYVAGTYGTYWGDFPSGLHRLQMPAAPTITAQPAPGQAIQGSQFILSVAATSSGPFNYQWYHNGVAVTNFGNGSSLYLGNFQPADAGSYYVVLTGTGFNAGTSVTSNTVTVSFASGAGVEQLDFAFNRPQFRRNSLPGRVTADQVSGSGKIYASFSNGNALTGANNQRFGPVVRLNANGVLDTTFNPGGMFLDAWATLPLANGQVLVAGQASDESAESGLPLFRVFRLNADGSRDWNYNSPVFSGIPRYMTLQPDGKLLVAPSTGADNSNGGLVNLIRLNGDGSQDFSFTPPTFDSLNAIFAPILVDGAGKIIIGGIFNTVNGVARPGVARLNANGTLDTGFVPSGFFRNPNNQIRGLALQTQGANAGKLLVAGRTIKVPDSLGTIRPIIRLNADGSIDSSFVLPALSDAVGAAGVRPRLLSVLPNDKFVSVSDLVTRFNADGSVDSSFPKATLSAESFWMDVQADGSVLVAPEFGATVNGTAVAGPFRLTNSGALDGAFVAPSFQMEVYPRDFKIQSDGRVLVWGNFDTVNTTARHGLARINTDGSVDTLNLSGVANLYSVNGAKVLSDGRMLVATQLGTYQNNLAGGVSRFNTDGTVDPTFTLDPLANVSSLQALPDGRLLTWNQDVQTLVNTGGIFFKRLTLNGAIDNTYAGLGATAFGAVYRTAGAITSVVQGRFEVAGVYPDGRALAIATTPNGSYPAGATSLNVTLLRLNADGTMDNTFNAPSIPWSTSSSFTDPITDPQNVPAGSQQYPLVAVGGSPFSGVVPQADGSVIVFGAFTSLNGNAAPGIARLAANGAFDPTFSVGTGPELRGKPGRHPQVQRINVAPDGKLWVTGLFDTFAGVTVQGVVRLNADGTLDTTFATNLAYRSYLGNGTKVDFGPSGQVFAAGTFAQSWESFPFGLTRLVSTVAPAITAQPQNQTATAGGSATFSVGVTPGLTAAYQWFLNGTAITGATNSTLVLTNITAANIGSYTVTVTTALGSVTSTAATLADAGGGAGAPVISVQPASTAIIAGTSGSLSVTATGTVTGYQWRKFGQPIAGATTATLSIPSAGLLDVGLYDVQVINGLAITTSNAARVDVNPATYGNVLRPRAGFAPVFEATSAATALVAAPGGAFYAMGTFTSVDGLARPGLARFLSSGALDTTYAPVAISGPVYTAVLQTDGKLVIGGNFRVINGVSRNFIARLNTDGTLDTSFTTGSGFSSNVSALALQADGKIVAGGIFNGYNGTFNLGQIARLNTNGTLDTSFATGSGFNSSVNALAIDGAGNVLVGGLFTAFNGVGTNVNRLARLTSGGALDASFTTAASTSFTNGNVNAIAIYPAASASNAGKIVVGGNFTGVTRSYLTRLTATGTVDASFMATGSGFNNTVNGVALQADDSVLATGFFGAINGAASVSRFNLARLNGTDGTVDTAFNPPNGLSGSGFAVSVMTDGRIVVGGYFNFVNDATHIGVVRFNPDGTDAGVTSQLRQPGSVTAVVPAAGGKWVVAGGYNWVNGAAYNCLARLNADGTTDTTFVTGAGSNGFINAMVGQPDGVLTTRS